MTLINVFNVKDQAYRAKTFDVRHILEKYGKFEFGVQKINQIHLAVMKSKDTDGFYESIASIQF